MKIFNYFKENLELIRENSKMRISKKQIEEALSDLQQKYINLLEWKCNQFDLYLVYQTKCEELIEEKKDLKKQLAKSNENNNVLTEDNHNLDLKIEKLTRKICRLEKKDK